MNKTLIAAAVLALMLSACGDDKGGPGGGSSIGASAQNLQSTGSNDGIDTTASRSVSGGVDNSQRVTLNSRNLIAEALNCDQGRVSHSDPARSYVCVSQLSITAWPMRPTGAAGQNYLRERAAMMLAGAEIERRLVDDLQFRANVLQSKDEIVRELVAKAKSLDEFATQSYQTHAEKLKGQPVKIHLGQAKKAQIEGKVGAVHLAHGPDGATLRNGAIEILAPGKLYGESREFVIAANIGTKSDLSGSAKGSVSSNNETRTSTTADVK